MSLENRDYSLLSHTSVIFKKISLCCPEDLQLKCCELESSQCWFGDFLNVPEECFLTKTRRILDRIVLTAAGLLTDPKTGSSQHRGDPISIICAGHRQKGLSWQWVPVLSCVVSQVTCRILNRKCECYLFKEALASRKSSKISELGKRKLFWLKNESQRRVKVGKLPERRKGKWIIMNIN